MLNAPSSFCLALTPRARVVAPTQKHVGGQAHEDADEQRALSMYAREGTDGLERLRGQDPNLGQKLRQGGGGAGGGGGLPEY